jgi:hypothetical protein
MKTMEGWRKMSHNRGFQNEITGQTITVKKKEFGTEYAVWLMPNEAGETEGKKISPEFASESKAYAFAQDWMKKNPNSIT